MSDEVIPLIPLPQYRKAKASVWRDIGVAETDQLLVLKRPDETKAYLQSILGIAEDPNGKHIILLDMFYYATQFCQKNSFDSEKTSSLLSIIKQTHEMATETPFGNIRETLEFFKDLVLCHSVHRPPFSLGIFSPQEASAISYYVIDTYFRHFKLYKYAFTPQVQLDLSINYLKMPKTPRELDEERRSVADENAAASKSQLGETDAAADGEDGAQQQQQQHEEAAGDSEAGEEAQDPRSESMRELRRIVRERLTAELQDLKSDFASQLKQSDETLTKLVSGAPESGKKSARQSAKKKK